MSPCAVCQQEATQTCSACGRAFYCNQEHQKQDWKNHKKICVCYKIQRDEILGRCVKATRDISPGEVIMKSSPLVLGPKTVSVPLCLTCHKKFDLETNRYDCRKCGWPLCDQECEVSPLHTLECEVLAKAPHKPTVKNDNSKQSVYSSIAPLRALLLKQQPQKFDLLMTCQSHLDKHRSTPIYQILKRNLVPFFELLQIDTNETEILTICSIFDTNCFEVRDSEGLVQVRGVYPTIAFLSHDCKHNTKHSFHGKDFTLILTATVPIKKGDLITTTYTQTLWNTLARRSHLKMSKQFDCACQRCADPTELGTYAGSVVCNQCGEGMVVSCDVQDPDSDWSCEKCGFEVSGEEVLWGNDILKTEVASLDKTNPESLEEFLERYDGVLHGKNSFCLQVKYALSQMYGNLDGFKLEELPDELLDRKIGLCQDLLDVSEVLEPGYSRFRGLLLFDLHEATMVKVKRGDKGMADRAAKLYEEASEILKTEPDLIDFIIKKVFS